MTLQEKKRAIIKKIKESTSDDFISKIYFEINDETPWNETKEGNYLILKLLEKSQQDVYDGKIRSFDEVLKINKEKYNIK